MTFASLKPLADRAALFAVLRQDALSTLLDTLGERQWEVDLDAGTLTLTSTADSQRRLVLPAQLIATVAVPSRSLRWGWAHARGAGDAAAALRTYGAEQGVDALTSADLPADEGAAIDSTAVAHLLGGVVAEATGRAPVFVAEAPGGPQAVLLVDAPLAPLSVAHALTALPRLLPGLELPDARTAVWNLARLAGWQLAWGDEAYSAAIVSDATGSATFRFDETARIVEIEGAPAV